MKGWKSLYIVGSLMLRNWTCIKFKASSYYKLHRLVIMILLAVVAMAGLAAEGLQYDKVIGQSADLFTLQRFINRSKTQLSKDQQQNLTRWAVLFAASLNKNNRVLHEALMSAMSKKSTVLECIEAIEKAE